ncbi:MAG TPA: FAD-binding protein, partial [Acidobacteriota bacterium]|nr:FAD-binding protein [Acidobacteriota bacterium]
MKAEKLALQKCLSSTSAIYGEPSSLRIYSFDQGEVPPSLRKALVPNSDPDLAVQPGTLTDLESTIRFCLDEGKFVVPRGASTYGMGGAVPHLGGILLDFSMRREIYEFNAGSGTIRVGAGARWSDVSEFLKPRGYDLCAYPTSWFSTVGGWTSTGGCGIGCTRYGSFHGLIQSITVVDASGAVRRLSVPDPEFRSFLGTEGQMGAIWDITFQVRKKPAVQFPFVILFDEIQGALDAAAELLRKFHPFHMKFLDAARVHEINHLMREEHSSWKSHLNLPEKPCLLLCLEDPSEAEALRGWSQKRGVELLSDFRAHLLWRERMFPLRVKRIAPGLLASELILPLNKVASFAKKAATLGEQFGVRLATECYFLNDGTALTLPVYTFSSKGTVDEALKSSLAFVLTQAGIRLGGRPYGIGIWNSPFLKYKFGDDLERLKQYKKQIDPHSLFNPGKFFELKFRTGMIGKAAAFPLKAAMIPIWTAVNPLLARFLTRKNKTHKRPSDLILENEELCSKCGSCISVCPAYIQTKDERTTARGKLQLGKLMLNGGTMTAEEANVLFLCMHCGACTDVCQSRLDLVPVWDELERRVETHFGKDLPRVQEFVS